MNMSRTRKPAGRVSGDTRFVKVSSAVIGRRHVDAAPNSLRFLVDIEGVEVGDGSIRHANGTRWRVA
jgi:hypothetical protein